MLLTRPVGVRSRSANLRKNSCSSTESDPPTAECDKHPVGWQVGRPYHGGGFGDRGEAAADEHLVHELDELARAGRSDVGDSVGEIGEHRSSSRHILVSAAEHERELAPGNRRCSAGQRRIDPAGTAIVCAGGEVSGAVGSDARHVGDQQAGSIPGEDAMSSEDHLLHQRGGVQGEHDGGAAGEVLRRGRGGGRVGGERVHDLGAYIVNPQRMPGLQEPTADGGPHDPESNHTDFGALINGERFCCVHRCCSLCEMASVCASLYRSQNRSRTFDDVAESRATANAWRASATPNAWVTTEST
jgi:hypothetical protein